MLTVPSGEWCNGSTGAFGAPGRGSNPRSPASTTHRDVRRPCEHMFVHPREASGQDLSWLAGLLGGEGSFLAGSPSAPHRPSIQVVMIDQDVVERVGRLVDREAITCKARRPEWSP